MSGDAESAVTIRGIELQPEDYRPIRMTAWPFSLSAWTETLAPWLASFALLALLGPRAKPPVLWASVLILWSAALLWRVARGRGARARMQAAASAAYAYDATLNAEGITTSSPRGSQRWRWTELGFCREDSGRFFYGPAQTVLAGLIPKRCMSDDQIETARGLIARHAGPQR